MNPFFDNAPGFDQPLAVLKHCHDRIRKQLATLDKLLAHLPVHGADQQAQQAAQAVLRYFSKAAPLHHEDEEIDLLPTLQQTAQNADALLLQELLPVILQQHEQMASQWHMIEAQLLHIADASSTEYPPLPSRIFLPFTPLTWQSRKTRLPRWHYDCSVKNKCRP